MRQFIYSCFDHNEDIYSELCMTFISEVDSFCGKFAVKRSSVFSDIEVDAVNSLIRGYNTSGRIPTMMVFCSCNPVFKVEDFNGVTELKPNDLRSHLYAVIDARINRYVHNRMVELNNVVKDYGITDEIVNEFEKLQDMSNRGAVRHIPLTIDSRAIYESMKGKSLGLKTGVKEVDERIGGLSKGTVTTIAGFTSQYKTTFALNIARRNAYEYGFNIAYFSLETPKQDMNWNLLACHSFGTDFPDFPYIPHDRMRKGELTPEEEAYLFDEVDPDLKGLPRKSKPGVVPKERGKIVFIDESDLDSMSFREIRNVLEKVDEDLIAETGKGLDAVIVDYVQLCKFSGSGHTNDANAVINSYVTFFRKLGQSFKREVDANGNEYTRQLIMVLLSQINRENWRRARNNKGMYDITCLADANELERGSYRVLTTYTSEDLKGMKEAQVQILKNRTGQTMYDPATVYADGASYVFMSEESISSNISASVVNVANLANMFDTNEEDAFYGSVASDKPSTTEEEGGLI